MWLVKYQPIARPVFCIVYGEKFVWPNRDGTKVLQKWKIPEEHRDKTIDQLKQLYVEKENSGVAKNLNFSQALEEIKNCERVSRAGWNGKEMWLILVNSNEYTLESYKFFSADGLEPFIAMKTADDRLVPWLCSQTDMLAEDWEVVS